MLLPPLLFLDQNEPLIKDVRGSEPAGAIVPESSAGDQAVGLDNVQTTSSSSSKNTEPVANSCRHSSVSPVFSEGDNCEINSQCSSSGNRASPHDEEDANDCHLSQANENLPSDKAENQSVRIFSCWNLSNQTVTLQFIQVRPHTAPTVENIYFKMNVGVVFTSGMKA